MTFNERGEVFDTCARCGLETPLGQLAAHVATGPTGRPLWMRRGRVPERWVVAEGRGGKTAVVGSQTLVPGAERAAGSVLATVPERKVAWGEARPCCQRCRGLALRSDPRPRLVKRVV